MEYDYQRHYLDGGERVFVDTVYAMGFDWINQKSHAAEAYAFAADIVFVVTRDYYQFVVAAHAHVDLNARQKCSRDHHHVAAFVVMTPMTSLASSPVSTRAPGSARLYY